MPIKVTCKCGSQYTAKDELAGKPFQCRKCGAALQVPSVEEAEIPSDTYSFATADFGGAGNEPDACEESDALPAALPPKVTSRQKSKKKGSEPNPRPDSAQSRSSSPYAGMSLEERIAARAAETEEEQKGLKGRLSRINQGGGLLVRAILIVVIGVAFLIGAFVLPAVFHERYSDPAWTPDGSGDALLHSIHRSFGRVGVGLTVAAMGLGFLYGGWRSFQRWRFGDFEEDDD